MPAEKEVPSLKSNNDNDFYFMVLYIKHFWNNVKNPKFQGFKLIKYPVYAEKP